MVNIGDAHFGDPGTDVQRAFAEAEMIAQTDGMYAADMGDLINNFIGQFFASIRHDTRLTITDEWVILGSYLRVLGPKLTLEIGGNHLAWTQKLAGVDYLHDTLGAISPHTLYDAHECRVVIDVCGVEFPARFRHRWRGSSIYNPTHGIERAARFDDRDFVLGVGAHTHVAGVARQFAVGSVDCMAVLVGSYKRWDSYQREQGFPAANNSTAVAVILDAETKSMTGINNLELAARVMRQLRG